MSDARDVVERVLSAGVLTPGLFRIPDRGATPAELAADERLLPRPLSPQMKKLLSRWNGLNLDVVRVYGAGATSPGISRMSEEQLSFDSEELAAIDGPVVIGSDPSGFVYVEDRYGAVWSLDTDGGNISRLANDIDDFLGRLVFGQDAAEFGGPDWADTLRNAGLIS